MVEKTEGRFSMSEEVSTTLIEKLQKYWMYVIPVGLVLIVGVLLYWIWKSRQKKKET
jgi:membrane protein DedA with SNARE-associated domain